ncbi:MAG: hypothetical protein VYC40_02295 [Pseudomonadota bacterium]|nr:hypothetical protein [Pseudomonadota bacterium]
MKTYIQVALACLALSCSAYAVGNNDNYEYVYVVNKTNSAKDIWRASSLINVVGRNRSLSHKYKVPAGNSSDLRVTECPNKMCMIRQKASCKIADANQVNVHCIEIKDSIYGTSMEEVNSECLAEIECINVGKNIPVKVRDICEGNNVTR